MKIVDPSIEVTFYTPEDGMSPEQAIEAAGRTCYKSEDKITDDSADKFVRMLRERGHHAMLEFGYATARIVADRGLTHELVRHRLASFAQESTRYCNYSKDKFGSEITIIRQPGLEKTDLPGPYHTWRLAMQRAEEKYLSLLEQGVKPQIARSVLPIGLKTEIVIGANLREWRHIFTLRCAKAAHPIIRGVMLQALREFWLRMPTLYEDLCEKYIPVGDGDIFVERKGTTEYEVSAVLITEKGDKTVFLYGPPYDDGSPGRHTLSFPQDILFRELKRVGFGKSSAT